MASALLGPLAFADGKGSTRPAVISKTTYRKPPVAELQKRLSPIALEVTQRRGTEPPFRNPFWDHHGEGLYVDVVTGEPLFSSTDKFDSGTGWPSFTRPVEDGRVINRVDASHGMDAHRGPLAQRRFTPGPPVRRWTTARPAPATASTRRR